MSDTEEKRLDLRRKQWESLCEKYEKRGKVNDDECSFLEVSYKMFIKPPLKTKLKVRRNKKEKRKKIKKIINIWNTEATDANHRVSEAEKNSEDESSVSSTNEFLNVHVNTFIDECSNDAFTPCDLNYQNNLKDKKNHNSYQTESDSGLEITDKEEEFHKTITPNSFINFEDDDTLTEMCNLEDQSDFPEVACTEDDHLHKLICVIEKELKSNLKVILQKRSLSVLLDLDEYSYWHKCTKVEMTRLEKYISRNDLKEYMTYCYNPENINVHLIHNVIVHKMKSNIRKLFFKREFSRHNKIKYLKYRKKVILEWQILCKEIPIDYLLLYGTKLLNAIEKLREEKNK